MTAPRKKRLLIRIGSLRHGGAEKVLVTFLKNLPENKYEIDLLLNLYSGKYLGEVPDFVNVFYLNKGEMITTNRLQDLPQKAFRVLFQKTLRLSPGLLYRFILKGKKYDIEFAAIHGMRDEILNSPQKNSKKIIWIHNDLEKTEFHDYSAGELRKFFGFDKILVISEKIRADFLKVAATEKEKAKIVRIFNPLDTTEILQKADVAITPKKTEVPEFLSVGTVFPQKGFDRLLRVHKKLLDENLPHTITILGDGYDLENLKKLQQELGVQSTVELKGFTENPYPHLRQADFFVLSSRYEGFPTVLSEAVVLKKKIIATDVSGVREILLDGKLGLITENSEDGIYTGMKMTLTQPDCFRRMEGHLETEKLPFTLQNSVMQLIKILDEL